MVAMGVCGLCKREMENTNPCTGEKAIQFMSGDIQEAVRVGSRWIDGPCPDCNSPQGSYHHPGCDWEECPRCEGQLLGCECRVGQHMRFR